MLGVKATTDSAIRLRESCLAPNIGLDGLRQSGFSLVFKLKAEVGSEQFKPAKAGQPAEAGEGDI